MKKKTTKKTGRGKGRGGNGWKWLEGKWREGNGREGKVREENGREGKVTCGCTSMVYCFWISPLLCVCGSAQCCVCMCTGAWHYILVAGTWYNHLHIRITMSFNWGDGGVCCSGLFICFTKVHVKLNWTLNGKPYYIIYIVGGVLYFLSGPSL